MLVQVLTAAIIGLKTVLMLLPAFIVMGLVERFLPVHGARPPLKAWLRGIVYQLIGFSLGAFTLNLLNPYIPMFHPIWPAMWIGVAFVVSDFFHYWEHRLQHIFLWRFHAVHHSTENLCCTSGYHHFSDALVFTLLYGIPMSLVTNDPLVITGVAMAVQWSGAYTHSPTKFGIGPLNHILTDNLLHRIHHSAEPRHFDKNFSAVFSFWDVLFGTMERPKKGEWPAAGIAEYREIETIWGVLFMPFLPQKRPLPAPEASAAQ
jgi:sterol desaturase/sphingolipid hydroxylase (fatty acid hydroxylase superfamily)